jgi:hypothetical protein
VDRKMIYKWVLSNWCVNMWIGFSWLKTGSSGGMFCVHYTTFRYLDTSLCVSILTELIYIYQTSLNILLKVC